MPSNIQVAALSDVGCVRTNNEDNFGYDPANHLYVVCDGMGGMAAGEVASSIACGTVIGIFASQPAGNPHPARLSLAIRAANDAVRHCGHCKTARWHGNHAGCAALEGSKLLIGNVGDSRAYLCRMATACRSPLTIPTSTNSCARARSRSRTYPPRSRRPGVGDHARHRRRP